MLRSDLIVIYFDFILLHVDAGLIVNNSLYIFVKLKANNVFL